MSWAPHLKPVYRWEVEYPVSNGPGRADSLVIERAESDYIARWIAEQHPGAVIRPLPAQGPKHE